MNFDGIYTPIITAHDADGNIDFAGFEQQVDYLVSAGVHGIISGGSTGEYYAQTIEERQQLARLAHQIIDGRVPLIVGTGAIQLKDSQAMAATAAEIGADAILVGTPPYAVPTERENALNALAIDRIANLPVMLYNYPGRMSVEMGEEFLDRVGQSQNFQAIKESSGDINRLHLLARDYPHIQLRAPQAKNSSAWSSIPQDSWMCG